VFLGVEVAVNFISHYKKLFFFLRHRFESDNYAKMRGYLSTVLVQDVSRFINLKGKRVLDVGGSSGEFCSFLTTEFGCSAVNLDPNPPKKHFKNTVKAFADNIPFKDNHFDFVICRGVLEHIPAGKRKKSVDEIYRVLKRGGTAYFVVPPWFNPHAGHMFKPFHILPFRLAKFLRGLIFGEEIVWNSYAEATLHPITFAESKRLFTRAGFKLLTTLDTHLRMHFFTKVPVLREFMVPAVTFVLKKE